VLFVPDTIVGGEWKVVLQKEAQSRHVVAEIDEPSLRTHSVLKGKKLVKEGLRAFHDGDVLSKEFREEVPTSEVQ
jgi:hypothetical protein